MKQAYWSLMVVALCGAQAYSADLNLTVRRVGDGVSVITVGPGEMVNYEVIGELTSSLDNEGLALFGFDLDLDGTNCVAPGDCDLPPTDAPVANPMLNFARPQGITNPQPPDAGVTCPPSCGFRGTVSLGNLKQVGGGQNTIDNTAANAPFPVGGVITNVGFAPVVLASGSFTAPAVAGNYILSIPTASVFANVISFGQMCAPDPMIPSTFCTTVCIAGDASCPFGGTIVDLALTVSGPAPICQSWQSMGVHGTVGEVPLDIPADGSYSEPRLSGINKLVVTFDSPIDVSAAFATVTGIDKLGAAVDVSPFSFPVTAGPGNTAVISVVDATTMAPAKLPGSDFAAHVPAKYCVVLDGVTGPGPGFAAAAACNRVMTVVLGDAFGLPVGSGKGDLLVNAADNGLVRSLASQGVGTSTAFDPNNLLHVRSDVFTNGTIDAADNGLARSLASQGLNGTGITIACP